MTTIPATEIVASNPSVLGAGGQALDLSGLVLTYSARVPIGAVQPFPDAISVQNYFGASSPEAAIAGIYFSGFAGADAVPGSILFAQYNPWPVAAFLRGGNISTLTLTQLQAISGALNITVDGYPRNASSVSLTAAASFTAAAGLIQTALNAADPTEATITASIGATFTGTGSGTNLTTSAVTGLISVGDVIAGTGVPGGTTIVSQTSGTPGGAGVYVTSGATTSAGASLTASSTVLNATAVGSGALAAGQTITGAGVTGTPVITAQLTGTAGAAGTYRLSSSPQQIASEAMTAIGTAVIVTYDSVSGAFVVTSGISGAGSTVAFATGSAAAPLGLTAATGAVVSQGAAAATPAAFMNAIVQVNTNWATFMTSWNPDGAAFTGSIAGTTLTVGTVYSGAVAIGQVLTGTGVTAGTTITAGAGLSWTVSVSQTVTSTNLLGRAPAGADGNTVKLAFAAWKNTQNSRYAYVCRDHDISPTLTVPAASSMGAILAANGDSGTCLVYEPTDLGLDAFVCGAAAAINFTETRGRITFAFKWQAGLTAGVTTAAAAINLAGNPQSSDRGNGYNFGGAYGAANAGFTWFQRGFVTGPYLWLDSYINQIWLNNRFQNAILTLFQNAKSVPYTDSGNSLIDQALADPIADGLNFGAYAPGAISASQIALVNTAAGANIAGTLQTQGWYLQILPASSAVRAARSSPPVKFWYLDRGAVQALTIGSIAVQ